MVILGGWEGFKNVLAAVGVLLFNTSDHCDLRYIWLQVKKLLETTFILLYLSQARTKVSKIYPWLLEEGPVGW